MPRGHVALAFVNMGVGFADRAAVVVTGFMGLTYQHLYNP